jgi:phenylacetate-CoA ligase
VRLLVQAGEPGASVPNVRRRLEECWGARIVDHAGATEVGAWGYACGVADHMHINEDEFVVELLDVESGEPVPSSVDEARGELVLTNLGRDGSPVVRYRTGDLVELRRRRCDCDSPFVYLEGGVLARLDDMIIVRGVNVYPAAIENVVRQFPEVLEFEVEVSERSGMSELTLRLEPAGGDAEGDGLARALTKALRHRLGLRVEVAVVAAGTLPRYELKARRFKFVDSER